MAVDLDALSPAPLHDERDATMASAASAVIAVIAAAVRAPGLLGDIGLAVGTRGVVVLVDGIAYGLGQASCKQGPCACGARV